MSVAEWSLLVGFLLITMVLAGTLLARLPLSTAMIYLGVGYGLGPGGLGLVEVELYGHAGVLARICEVAVLISLFAVGLKLGVPMRDRRWWTPVRLAFPVMALTVALIAGIGLLCLGLSPGAAVLLGAILAPTDPVLASGVQSDSGTSPERVRFSLAGEGALNDGTAFPFVLLGLGLLGLHPLGAGGTRWLAIDLLWSTLGGLLVGAALGALIGKLVVHLRTRHRNAVGLDEFLSLGLVAVSYGLAQLCHASGFLAVFAAGLALTRVRERPMAGTGADDLVDRATHSHHASSAMTASVRGFNEQLEKLAELAIVILIGMLLPSVTTMPALWWFIPALFVVVRPIAVVVGVAGQRLSWEQTAMLGWFGIRGIGSVFYLMFALDRGIGSALAQDLVNLTLVTVATSIVVHGVTALPLMAWHAARRARRRKPA